MNDTFYERVDSAILGGERSVVIAQRFGIRERTVRRRKASLLAKGFNITSLQGSTPGVIHASTSPQL